MNEAPSPLRCLECAQDLKPVPTQRGIPLEHFRCPECHLVQALDGEKIIICELPELHLAGYLARETA